METSATTPPQAELLADPRGKPLGRVMAPKPGPVVGRASGTVYLMRPIRPAIHPSTGHR
jgi:hypothetical protein